MKFFANRNIWKKIVIVFSLIFSMSFVKPAPVNASLAEIGGELMEPICDLLVWAGDGFLGVIHSLLVHQETTIIRVDLNNIFKKVFRIILTVGAFLLVLAAAAILTGAVVVAIGAVATALKTATLLSIGATILFNVVPVAIEGGIFFGAKVWTSDMFDNEIALPLYSISPERIFSNTIPFFDVNFFNPNSKPFEYEWIHKQGTGEKFNDVARASGKFIEVTEEEKKLVDDYNILQNGDDALEEVKNDLLLAENDSTVLKARKAVIGGKTYVQYVRLTQMTKEEVIADKDIDADEAGTYYKTFTYRLRDSSATGDSSSEETTAEGKAYALSYELANTVKFWYSIIKTLAIVGMMSVLVYIGIRILLSSTAEQQAKQKKLFGDWLIGMVLLFTMQYIMVFANIAVDHLTEMFRSINPMGQVAFIPDNDDFVQGTLEEGYNIRVSNDSREKVTENNMVVYKTSEEEGASITGEKGKYIEWHTDLVGHLRIALQANKNSGVKYIGYTIMFLVMIVYTGIFIFIYIKRVIYMAFLTVIAPLVALTYPIDKANDGSAQGFNYWFKEYIFNLLLQPVHLLTYTILVSTAIKFATTNWLYSLIVLGFITQAEKIVRQMFNFSKASTPGIFAGPAGAALAMSGMRWLMGRGPNGGPRGGRSSSGNGSDSEDYSGVTSSGNKKVPVNADTLDKIFGQGDSNSSPLTPGQADNSRVASVLNSGNNGSENGENSTNNGGLLFSSDNNGLDQAGDYWDNYYGTNEFTDGDIGYDQTGENWNDFYDTDEFTDGDIRFYQVGENWNDFYDTDEFSGDNSTSSSNVKHGSNSGNIGSGNIRSNGRLSSANSSRGTSGNSYSSSSRGTSGNSYSPTTSSNNNQGQTRTTTPESRTNSTSRRRRLSGADEYIARRNEEQRRQREQNQNSSSQRTQTQAEQPVSSNKNRTREEIEAKRRERAENHPVSGWAVNQLGKAKDGTVAIASSRARGVKQNVKRSLKEGRPGKAVARTISGVAGAATFGTLGVALSIASGDAKTVATGAVAGVAGGYKVGTGVGNAVENVVKTDESVETFLKGYLGDKEYKNQIVEENQKDKALDPKRIKRIQDKKGMSRKEAEEYATLPEHTTYMENKIDDIDDWFALDDLIGTEIKNADGSNSGRKITAEHAVAIYKEYKRSGMDSKDHEKAIAKIMSDFGLKEDNEQDKATAEKWYQNMKLLDDIING